MKREIKINKFFHVKRRELFSYFVISELLQQWSYPDGMKLKVPQFEGRSGGRYRYEHEGKDGKYLCVGHIEEFELAKKIVIIDEVITGPDKSILFEKLKCIIEFKDKADGLK